MAENSDGADSEAEILDRPSSSTTPSVTETIIVHRTALCGLLVLKIRWSFSVYGWMLSFALAVILGMIGMSRLYGFLAINSSIPTDVLVIDGWMPTYDLERAASEFKRGQYKVVLAVRGVYDFDSIELSGTWDDYVRSILIRHGIPRDRLRSVLFPGLKRDRTFTSALAVKEWFYRHQLPLRNLELLTVGPHARRSRLLYRLALGEKVDVGVIGLDDPAYDSFHWWRSSEGLREVLFEGVAYLYVKILFAPGHPTQVQLLESSN